MTLHCKYVGLAYDRSSPGGCAEQMHLAWTRRSTAPPWPAHAPTCVGGTPALSHDETAAFRRS
jgi:hypothetical protein